jgi:hypothetical protein
MPPSAGPSPSPSTCTAERAARTLNSPHTVAAAIGPVTPSTEIDDSTPRSESELAVGTRNARSTRTGPQALRDLPWPSARSSSQRTRTVAPPGVRNASTRQRSLCAASPPENVAVATSSPSGPPSTAIEPITASTDTSGAPRRPAPRRRRLCVSPAPVRGRRAAWLGFAQPAPERRTPPRKRPARRRRPAMTIVCMTHPETCPA